MVPQRQVRQDAPQLIPRPPAANGRPPQWLDLDPHFTVDAYLDYFFINFRTCYFTHTAYALWVRCRGDFPLEEKRRRQKRRRRLRRRRRRRRSRGAGRGAGQGAGREGEDRGQGGGHDQGQEGAGRGQGRGIGGTGAGAGTGTVIGIVVDVGIKCMSLSSHVKYGKYL